MYYRISLEHAGIYGTTTAEYENLESSAADSADLDRIQRRMEECYGECERAAVVSITFAGMAIEAFLFDYAAERLGDTFVRDTIDKLDVKAKYLIYPLLICGKKPEKDGQAYESLASLITIRNYLVHAKSKPFDMQNLDEASAFVSKRNDNLTLGVKNATLCIPLMMRELDKLHGSGTMFSFRMGLSV